jgi:hypothetical protein
MTTPYHLASLVADLFGLTALPILGAVPHGAALSPPLDAIQRHDSNGVRLTRLLPLDELPRMAVPGLMITLLLHLLRLLPFLCGGHRQVALENLALRQQLTVYKQTVTRPPLCRTDRLFWVGLTRVWAGWKRPLMIVTPDTILRWHRRRFREYWTKLSRPPTGGRPPVHTEIKVLVTRMATANPLWGAPRIHGELLKLGIAVAERTVSRLLPKRLSPPSQTWRTFLANHICDHVSSLATGTCAAS